ncbi:hypothetical protein SCHPADRAFT_672607 [Schizopora paradoxa]|uniref:DUF6533 domain-containing protein n=1 Tax=Schizopora paradoxa TaxID=27342 RepID=A0A0H2R582_9AGAM|nr:hypothetical protein SCHPADRAFT_672607 [Schizopora paradoxa]
MSSLVDLLVSIFWTVRIVQYIAITTISLVAYEYLIKLDDEIRYLWGRRVSFGGILMALCRYLPFVNVLTVIVDISMPDMDYEGCLMGYRAYSSFIFIEFTLSTLVLFTRAYAVWGGSWRILSILVIVFTGSSAGSFYALFLFLSNTDAPPLNLPTSCIFDIKNDDVWIALVVLVFCESLALGLLLIKSIEHARAMRYLSVNAPRRSILAVMTQDGIGYFACTLALTSANLVILERVTPDLRDFLFIIQGALSNILCSRLLFHVRAVNDSPSGTFANYSIHIDTLARSQLDQEIELSFWKRRDNISTMSSCRN